jgi:hypothetical protein
VYNAGVASEKPTLNYQRPGRPSVVATVLTWAAVMALIVGAIGFVVGYFGPLIFYPGSNQGPLLGIFLTGPLGFVGGGFFGALVGLIRAYRSRRRDLPDDGLRANAQRNLDRE